MTVTMWYYSNQVGLYDSVVSLRNRNLTPYDGLIVVGMTDKEYPSIYVEEPGSVSESFTSDYAAPKDQWIHFAISYDRDNSEYLINPLRLSYL